MNWTEGKVLKISWLKQTVVCETKHVRFLEEDRLYLGFKGRFCIEYVLNVSLTIGSSQVQLLAKVT